MLWGIAVRAPVVHFLAVDVVAKVSAEHGVSLALVQSEPEVCVVPFAHVHAPCQAQLSDTHRSGLRKFTPMVLHPLIVTGIPARKRKFTPMKC